VLSVAYSRTGLFATVGRDNTARLWKADGSPLDKLGTFTDLPSRIVFSHDGERVFAGDFTGKIRVWDVKAKKQVGELTTNPD
jgi:WD40 repeat protein